MKQEKADLETVLLINAKVGIALFDASILCWEAKYKFNVLRPVSYIQANIEKGWVPPFNDPTMGEYGIGLTPQHPSYSSVHAIFGQAFAEVLINVFGDNINLTDRTHEGENAFDGRPRTFKHFSDMVTENAYS